MGVVNPPQWMEGESEILLGEGGIFLPGEGNLRRSDFDDSTVRTCLKAKNSFL